MALTQEEIQILRESWEPVKKDMDPVGKLLFQVMFEQFPEYKELFLKFQEEGKSLIESEKFLKHATANVMISFNRMVESLEDEDKLKPFLQNLGARHFRRNVNSKHFKAIIAIVMETLRRGLGDAFTLETEAAWSKALDYTMNMMGEACDAAGNKV